VSLHDAVIQKYLPRSLHGVITQKTDYESTRLHNPEVSTYEPTRVIITQNNIVSKFVVHMSDALIMQVACPLDIDPLRLMLVLFEVT